MANKNRLTLYSVPGYEKADNSVKTRIINSFIGPYAPLGVVPDQEINYFIRNIKNTGKIYKKKTRKNLRLGKDRKIA